MTSLRKLLLLFAVLALGLVMSVPASAHSGPTYYPYYYQSGCWPSCTIGLEVHLVDKGDGYWTQAKRDRVQDAIDAWNATRDVLRQPALLMYGDWGSVLAW